MWSSPGESTGRQGSQAFPLTKREKKKRKEKSVHTIHISHGSVSPLLGESIGLGVVLYHKSTHFIEHTIHYPSS
jgi:hypothetical protein